MTMESLLNGRVLLVGEGDFSFAVSLVQKLPSNQYSSILATSLETENSIHKHCNAASNILELQKHGVLVLLSTDATQLHTDPRTCGEKFNCIIFNFPHAGGKSNHKKNRKLLNDFFASAVQVLDTQGQILMTLCKGQGGTPADRPMRAWHDSWQVVSMAANSSLILVKILPFKAEEYTVYTSTGFRSLDKGFHTDNALTHVFEAAQPVEIPTHVDMVKVRLGRNVYLYPPYLYKKMQQIRVINGISAHPFNRIYHQMILHLQTSVPDLQIEDLGLFPPITRPHTSDTDLAPIKEVVPTPIGHSPISKVLTIGNESSSVQLPTRIRDTSANIDTTAAECNSCYTMTKLDYSDENCSMEEGFEAFLDKDGAVVDSTMVDECLVYISDPLQMFRVDWVCEKLKLQYGPIFCPCTISPKKSVVSFYINIIWPIIIKTNDDQESDYVKKEVERVTNILLQMIETLIGQADVYFRVECNSFQISDLFGLNPVHISDINVVGNSDTSDYEDDKSLGSIYLKGWEGCSNSNLFIVINLSKLACHRHKIEDHRLLWSDDYRVLNQFEGVTIKHAEAGTSKAESTNFKDVDSAVDINSGFDVIQNSGSTTSSSSASSIVRDLYSVNQGTCIIPDQGLEVVKTDDKTISVLLEMHKLVNKEPAIIKPASLYPMCYNHDMSFWENKDLDFDDLQFSNIIRNIAGDNITSVTLIDSYMDTVTGRISRCYRLIFQSIDKGLSYDTSWKLQSIIRLQVEKEMKITLR